MSEKNNNKASLVDYVKAWPQYLLPHGALSNLMFLFTRSEKTWWKNPFIRWFVKQYDVDMSEAVQQDITCFNNFNAFFTRELKADARPVASAEHSVACPVDGYISQLGPINEGRVFQAKGRDYSLNDLLAGNDDWVKTFTGGQFATIYLSPKNYHRIHMPVSGTLTHMTYVPGRLFSVSPATARAIPRLFARNERVIARFETEAGPLIMILVGAIFVGSMETVWHGVVTPPHGQKLQHWDYMSGDHSGKPVTLKRGEEMGRFNMGSTVILLTPENVHWSDLQPGQPVRMGQEIATVS